MTLVTRRACIAGFGASLIVPAMAARAQDALATRFPDGKVTIGIHNRNPWGYRTVSGSIEGYEPDIVRLALQPLGIKSFDFVIADFGALIPGLLARRFDIVASGVAITADRCKQVIFSEPDLSVVDGVIVQKGNPLGIHSFKDVAANPKFRLAGGRGDLNTKDAIAGGVSPDQVTTYPGSQEEVAALLAGRVDGLVTSGPTANMLLKDAKLAGLERAAPFTGLLRPDGTPAGLVTAIAFRPDDTAVRDAYNRQLAKLKADGTVKTIMARYGFIDGDTAPAHTTAELCADL